ncbi:integrase [Kitasatospora sp. MAA4]|uniref:tyrosine-type recombinase/integrase n=1 Tax=Kitasatospora sp. MAA4 TaxID=3035093 RepID=UPI002474B2F4|nr:site-specific integrase [Kitasatospora sp. MAA4]MDH6134629.1 integrase [Kitasatospora sp. MAA4]
MASIRVRERKDGGTTYTVTWRDGGGRNDPQQDEKFDDDTSAERFRDLVNGFGQHWPPGWVKGKGFVEEEPAEPEIDPAHMFEAFALAYVDLLTGVQGDTKAKYRKLIRNNMVPWFRDFSVADGELSLTSDPIKLWVNDLENGRWGPHRPEGARARRKYKAKTIRDNHGLLSGILGSAVLKELRATNPCQLTRLPRADDSDSDEMCFLEHWEYGLIHSRLVDISVDAADMVELAAGTGMRWGEITALQPRDLVRRGGRPALRVQRAWKYDEDGGRYMGPPKTRKSRRTLVLTPRLHDILRQRVKGKGKEDLLFTAPMGGAWQPATFRRDYWLPAIEAARENGLTKTPRFHDIRHTHAAWLIAAKLPLPAIQARLGHESIQTTVDRYGHLLDILDAEVIAAVDHALTQARVVYTGDVAEPSREDLAAAA